MPESHQEEIPKIKAEVETQISNFKSESALMKSLSGIKLRKGIAQDDALEMIKIKANKAGYKVTLNDKNELVYTNADGSKIVTEDKKGFLGVKEINTVSNFSVSPNPANDVINVKLNSSASAAISITDLAGKVVKNTTVNGVSTSISTSGLNEGVYFVNVTIGNSTSTEKIVIKK